VPIVASLEVPPVERVEVVVLATGVVRRVEIVRGVTKRVAVSRPFATERFARTSATGHYERMKLARPEWESRDSVEAAVVIGRIAVDRRSCCAPVVHSAEPKSCNAGWEPSATATTWCAAVLEPSNGEKKPSTAAMAPRSCVTTC